MPAGRQHHRYLVIATLHRAGFYSRERHRRHVVWAGRFKILRRAE